MEKPNKNEFDLDYVGIKASQFSFSRLQKADPVLGVDMASTGEVGCIGLDTSEAVLKAMLSVGYQIPQKNILLSTGTTKQKADMLEAAQLLHQKGYNLFATGGTHQFLTDNGIPAVKVYWPSESDREPQALEMLHNKQIDLVVNIPKNLTQKELDMPYRKTGWLGSRASYRAMSSRAKESSEAYLPAISTGVRKSSRKATVSKPMAG